MPRIAHYDDPMRERRILPLILSMSLPMVLSMLVSSLYNIVDSYFVAMISEDAMTALSLVFPLQNLVSSIGVGFGIGVNAVIAYHLGAGEQEKADGAATAGLILSALHGLLLLVSCIAAAPFFLSMFMMIFGIGPFPAMGIDGAALATGVGQLLSLLVYLAVYLKTPMRVRIRRDRIKDGLRMAGRLYSVGIPATLNLALPSVLISSLNAMLSSFSEVYTLILGIYYKLQTFLYLPASGFVQGMRPVIGYNNGAGERERVRGIFLAVLAMCAVIMLIGTILCLAIPESLIGLFTDNPLTLSEGARALRIISIGFVVSSVSVTSSGALEGLGKGLPSLVISLLRYIVLIIPLAYVLCFIAGLGPDGVWASFWMTEVLTAAASLAIYRKSVH